MPASAQAFLETQKLVASDASTGDHFSDGAVSVSGNVAFVGAWLDDNEGGPDAGAVYVFERIGGVWVETQKLIASDADEDKHFGQTVSVSGDVAVVGRPTASPNNQPGWGSVYVFERNEEGIWTEVQRLAASDSAPFTNFGRAVAASEEVFFVGSRDGIAGPNAGSVYVFTRSITGDWYESQKLTASDGAEDDGFGRSVSISGDVALIGAAEFGNSIQRGSAYVFTRAGLGQWVEQQKLTQGDTVLGTDFGGAVSVSGAVAVIGARLEYVDGVYYAGAAYVFEEDERGGWTRKARLVARDPDAQDNFGISVSVSDGVVLAGAYGESDLGLGRNSGVAYVFARSAVTGVWVRTQELAASDGDSEDFFGETVAISGSTAVVGAQLDENASFYSASQGSAYVFETAGPPVVAFFASGDDGVTQGESLTVEVEAQNLTAAAVPVRLVLHAVGPGGQTAMRSIGMGTLPGGATFSRALQVPVGNAPTGEWRVQVRLERPAGAVLGVASFPTYVYASAQPVNSPTFGEVSELPFTLKAPTGISLTARPNPSRDRVTLGFELPGPAHARLVLYDALGREVAVLVDREREAGRHEVILDAGRIAAGTYVVRLEVGVQALTQRITVTK